MKRDWVFRFDTYNNSLTFLSAVFIILVKSADLWLSSEENKTKQIKKKTFNIDPMHNINNYIINQKIYFIKDKNHFPKFSKVVKYMYRNMIKILIILCISFI